VSGYEYRDDVKGNKNVPLSKNRRQDETENMKRYKGMQEQEV
jgi:hypothetical protein